MQTILSFDFGHKKIGLAIGNTLTQTANELATLTCNNYSPNWVQLDKLINEWQPSLLLVGLPLNMDGTANPFSQKSKLFGKQLENRYNLPVEYQDERLSSNQADKVIRETLSQKQGASKKLLVKRDQIAARLILESYFNRHE